MSVNLFSTKVLIGEIIFTSPNGDGTAILRGHPSHAKVSPLAVQRKYLHFSVILRPWVMVRPRELNPRPPVLQSNALPTELILPRLERKRKRESRRQASEAYREKWLQRSRLRDKKRRHFFVGRTRKFCSGGDKMRNAIGYQCKVKLSGSEKKVNENMHVRHFLPKTCN